MVDPSDVRKQLFISTVSSKLFWIPTVIGGAIGLWAQPPASWLGWAAVGVGVASAVWKLTIGSTQLTEHTVSQLRAQADREHRADLRRLQKKLRVDRDPHTGEMLRKLRDLYGRIGELADDPRLQKIWHVEVLGQIRNLYESCLSALERSFELWHQSREMSTAESRQQLLERRADVLAEVERSLEQLGKTVDHLQASAIKDEVHDDDLSQMRAELEQGLEVARNVERQIETLENELESKRSPIRDPS